MTKFVALFVLCSALLVGCINPTTNKVEKDVDSIEVVTDSVIPVDSTVIEVADSI